MKLQRSESENILPGISEEKFLRVARRYVESAFPNPDRIGCPGREQLEILGQRKRAPMDAEIEHIGTCSPCFAEYQSIRTAWKRRRATLIWSSVAATVAIAVFSSLLLLRSPRIPSPAPDAKEQVEVAKEIVEKRLVDLRPYERVRGEDRNDIPTPLILERANLDLTIQLPVGSEEGRYVFELLDSRSVRHIETSGEAAIKNYITTAQARFDLRGLSPGRFTLTVRRVDASRPIPYPVEVR